MPSAGNYFTSVQSEKTVNLNDFWSFYINPSSPVNVLKLKLWGRHETTVLFEQLETEQVTNPTKQQIRDAPSATVTSTEKIFQGWMRKKAREYSAYHSPHHTTTRHRPSVEWPSWNSNLIFALF